ncbi:hypothetical protein LO762_12240 [Actinocorallia sp. API 0066]|uniref:hypothetical protein n=1 Tax=Actinocorallia sp. API 0066 TaxID=2896846 RepID=UPI001E4C70B3|nr:hypothetical protein [Actinocorallia sp. API 0066]MCD0449954.1 hypothetical protein [Actinocorallia sp. API 0066]
MRARSAALLLCVGATAIIPAVPAPAAPGDAALVVHTTVTTAQPRRGADVTGQVWVAATGEGARNATLSFSAEPNAGVVLEAVCTRTAQGYCKLGDVDAAGTSVPFTIRVKAGAEPLTVTLGAFTRGDDVESAWEYTKVTFRPAKRPRPTEPEPSGPAPPDPASPSATPATPSGPAVPAPVATPPVVPPPDTAQPSATPDPGMGLPQVADSTGATPGPGYVIPAPTGQTLPATELTGAREVSPVLALSQSVWLGFLLAACTLAAAVAFRRGARIRRGPAGRGK